MTSTRPAVAAPRVSPGVPSGGQFAAHGHTETDVVLAEEPSAPTAAPPTTAELFEQAQRSGKFWSRRLGVDADELCQSAMLAYFEADASRGRKQDGDSVSASSGVAENPRGYIHGVSRRIAAQMLNGKRRSEDSRAQVVFRERESEAEQKLNRRLTETEAEAIAAEIRASMLPKRRPSPGFQRPRQVVPWDKLTQTTQENMEHSMSAAAVEVNEQEFAAGSAGEQAEKLVDRGGRSGFVQARRLAYDVMAEKIGGPAIARGTVTEYSAQASRKVLADAGGVRAVVNAWRAGDTTTEQEKALFVPFKVDGPHIAARKSVSATLVASGAYADDVWASAMTAATRPHTRAPDAPTESTRAPAAPRPHTPDTPDTPDAPDASGWFR